MPQEEKVCGFRHTPGPCPVHATHRNISESFTWTNSFNPHSSPSMVSPVIPLTLHRGMGTLPRHTASKWEARLNLASWHQNPGWKPLYSTTFFQNEWNWFRLWGKVLPGGKEGGSVFTYSVACGTMPPGSVERHTMAQFWMEAFAEQWIADHLYGSRNWIESQIFYLKALLNSCMPSLQYSYLCYNCIKTRKTLADLWVSIPEWKPSIRDRMGDPPELSLSLN